MSSRWRTPTGTRCQGFGPAPTLTCAYPTASHHCWPWPANATHAASRGYLATLAKAVPMQRPQTADDVAHCVAFLCGDAARHITGQVIGVDGGVTI
ncbi:MAG: SDR family oxidoreductase [Proteobacteria bacterium]|nr:SDR family oxidoreductase [Pseudomonadota bacterium]MDA0868297.1 SDR family oxidoreductase [Pseudomonadota bacterium]MDA1328274.1 SDR family oxidoreductase [Pseudomonadota bacterium]